jgi:thiosulfate/3-mercaptopyruvate sulfurtransferase
MASEQCERQRNGVAALVSTAWLTERLEDPDLVVVDASVLKSDGHLGGRIWRSGRTAFETEGHIPHARFGDLITEFSDLYAPFAFTRPDRIRFAVAAGKIGISKRSRVVVYDNTNGIWAARLWWLLRAFGHDRAAVLDGGLKAWVAEDRPIAHGAASARMAVFTARERPDFFADTSDVLAVVEGRAPGLLACVLRRAVFTGAELRYSRPGHIPGSLNSPYEDLLGPDNRLLPIDALRKRLAPLIEPKGRIVLYCGGGITAAGTALVLTHLGMRDIAVYDGSLAEWTADPALPLALGASSRFAEAGAAL